MGLCMAVPPSDATDVIDVAHTVEQTGLAVETLP